MEIKRRIKAIDKRLTPVIESMNMADQMRAMCTRFEEILSYCEEKIERSKQRDGKTAGQVAIERRQARDKAVKAQQEKDREENIEDQEEAAEKRRLRDAKSIKPADVVTDKEGNPVPLGEDGFPVEFDVSEDSDIEANADEEAKANKPAPIPGQGQKTINTKKKAKKKAKKK